MTTLTLPEHILIRHTATLKQSWLQVLEESPSPLTLNGAAVERTDATGLTLVLSLIRQCEADGREWRWEQPSAALIDAANALGVAQPLHLPVH